MVIELDFISETPKKEEKITPKLDDKRLDKIDDISRNFITSLKAENFKDAKNYLSDLIIDQVTDKQLKALTSHNRF